MWLVKKKRNKDKRRKIYTKKVKESILIELFSKEQIRVTLSQLINE